MPFISNSFFFTSFFLVLIIVFITFLYSSTLIFSICSSVYFNFPSFNNNFMNFSLGKFLLLIFSSNNTVKSSIPPHRKISSSNNSKIELTALSNTIFPSIMTASHICMKVSLEVFSTKSDMNHLYSKLFNIISKPSNFFIIFLLLSFNIFRHKEQSPIIPTSSL